MKNRISLQQGLTLIELMISMTLSLIVIFAVGSILISSNQAASVSDTLADSQETGRFAVDYINRQLLRTGYDPDDAGVVAFGDLCLAAGDTVCIDEAGNGTGDRLAVRRIAEAGESNAVTCYGSALLDAANAWELPKLSPGFARTVPISSNDWHRKLLNPLLSMATQ